MARCQQEHIPTTLVLMPEGTAFRKLYSDVAWSQIDRCLGDISKEFDTPLVDARAWVPDDGFWDSHHMRLKGSRIFSDRIDRDVLPSLCHLRYANGARP